MSKTSKILIVDDEPIGRQLLEAILFTENYDLLFAMNGKEAYENAVHSNPDLILMDVMMPEMDGFEVTKKIRSDNKLKNVPIILITALDDRDSKIRGLDAGADDYISKPFDRVEVLAKVKNIISLDRYKSYETLDAEEKKEEKIDKDVIDVILSTLIPPVKLANTLFSNTFIYKNSGNSIYCITEKNNLKISFAFGSVEKEKTSTISNLVLLSTINHIILCETKISLEILIEQLKNKIKQINDSAKKIIIDLTDFYLSICFIDSNSNSLESTGLNSDIYLILKNKIQKINSQAPESKIATIKTDLFAGDSIFILSKAMSDIIKNENILQEKIDTVFHNIGQNPQKGTGIINDFFDSQPESKKYKEDSFILYLKI